MDKMIAERYMLVSSLGEGGMADVYLAIDTILNREVAVKILRGELSKDPVTLLRFQREANAVSKLNHPNVVDVYDVGEYEGRHYIIMEYIRGRTLKQLISQRGALHKEEAINIMMQLTSAVEHAHENNIIHRDIKPQNVLVKDDGTVKITDFGIALAHDTVQLTQSDAVLGSAHYLAPETTRGEVPTNQVDIYALGVVLYELLTGNVPFHGENPVQIAMKHLREEIPSVKEFNPTLPQSVENIIIKATVKNRKLRYHSALDMLHDLQNCLKPEYANIERLKFPKEEDPTVVMNQSKDIPQTKARKEKVIPIKEQQLDEKKNKKLNKLLVGGIVAICAIVVGAFIFLSMNHEKKITMPTISSSQTQEEAQQTLINAGFKKENIKIEKKLSDNIQEGHAISVSPAIGEKTGESSEITLTISRGTYFVLEDYKNQALSDIQSKLEEEMPKLKLEITKKQMAGVLSGRILSQSGIDVGEKLDPEKSYTLKVTVSDYMQFKIENIIGQSVEKATSLIKEKTGVEPVLIQLDIHDLPEEEQGTTKTGVVVEVNPAEGTWYTQDGESTITIKYY
ncbi:Stk1 family PASTA domain-containing Ser/Thr kinase [Amedibacillus sp. YH-ame6]